MINAIGVSGGSLANVTGQGGATRGEAVSRATVPAGAAEDRAAVSTTISRLAAGGPPIGMERVSALRDAIRSGSYRADPKAIASAMISSDLGVSQ